MTEILNLAVSVCTGLIWGSAIAFVVIVAAASWIFAFGHKAGRMGERARWEFIWPTDERLFRPYDNPADEALHELGIQP